LPGSLAPGSGGVESIITVAVCGDSMLPATSVEKNEIVWMPSPETLTVVPPFQPPPSTEYCVSAIPEPPSLGLSETVTPLDCQLPGALWPVLGAVLSTRRPATTLEVAWFPATSATTTRRSYRPSGTEVVAQVCEMPVHVPPISAS
jgi:hypothetical protein